MSDTTHKIGAGHLQRAAFVYIRQSSANPKSRTIANRHSASTRWPNGPSLSAGTNNRSAS